MKQGSFYKSLLLIILAVGLIWARSSYGKLSGGNFVSSLATVLIKNSQSNPYPFYKQFLTTVAIPNSVVFGNLTMWGEFLVAVSLVGGSLYLLLFKDANEKLARICLISGLIGGIFLNINFWFAFSWTSAASDSLNLLMILIQAIAAGSLKNNFLDSKR